ncbi:hypothetical protein FIBSPDRAFT_952278 [Athelia psychrophila]|uniref:Uncharacterized protein n=1 Tax=Athelia psychrophila TaxID=1759441 RepID=A0A166LQJ1_9AGAM|nr:hypothetical protein FIBSPDRAFT_952278 [Fibularhizoctonia sp. CBS 109695]
MNSSAATLISLLFCSSQNHLLSGYGPVFNPVTPVTVPIRYPFDMSSQPLSPPTCGVINHRLWVSPISSTLDRLHTNSWELKNPSQQSTGFLDHDISLGIDWSIQPAYYDLQAHWRGYLPIDAQTDPEWETSADYVTRSGRSGYTVKKEIVSWRKEKTDPLRKQVDELVFLLDFESNQVPFPRVFDTLTISYLHPTRVGVFRAMAISRAYYLALVAFYCWVWRVFKEAIEIRSWDEYYPATEDMMRWRGLRKAVGYLLDFSDQWKIHSAPMWTEHGIPFHYVWHEGLATNEHFRHWDPATLNAYNESTDNYYGGGMGSTTDFLSSGDHLHDGWLQIASPRSENAPATAFEMGIEYYSPKVRFFIEDFEGWHKRPLTRMTSGEIALLSSLYYYQDIQGDGSPYRKFFRWRERLVNSYRVIESSITEPFRLGTYILRETYKFRYSGYRNNSFQPYTERSTSSGSRGNPRSSQLLFSPPTPSGFVYF